MNKKKTSLRLGIGATSIFMIFSVLVMSILAILSYLKANSYYVSTIRQTEISVAYYQSEAQLLTKFYSLDVDHFDEAIAEYGIKEDEGAYTMEEILDDRQKLQLSFQQSGNHYKVISLKTVSMEE